MKIIKQLFKEFWLPLLIAILWTVWNYIISSSEKRTFTDVVNIAMPTFFFVSWLTGQYFRVSKQEHVSSTLLKIEIRVKNVLDDISKQASDMKLITDTQVFQTFDLCLDSLREVKEELLDKNRLLKKNGKIDIVLFELYRENPFYQSKRFLNRLINYALYTTKLNQRIELEDRYTRTAYHVEELAGVVTSFIRKMDQEKMNWKTPKSLSLIEDICNLVIRFKNDILPHSSYTSQPYKGNDLGKVLNTHISNLQQLYK